MRKKFSKSILKTKKPAARRQPVIHFDAEEFKPTPESLKVYEELDKIAKEIEKCRKRNLSA